MSISLRINEIISKENLTISSFEKKINCSTSTITRIIQRDSNVSGDILNKILITFPTINSDWLITGEGHMYKNTNVYNKGLPLLPIHAVAGKFIGNTTAIKEYQIEEYISIPMFNEKADCYIPMIGNSMHPKYQSGDILACKLKKNLDLIQWNKPYVLNIKEEGVVVKRLNEDLDKNLVLCTSDNSEYPPFRVKKEDILNLAIIVGYIRYE